MKLLCACIIWFCCAAALAADAEAVRIVSWNISGDSHEEVEQEFRSIMIHTAPDILVLDEVLPTASPAYLQDVLNDIDDGATSWNIDIGASGGRQRSIIASRWPVESLPEFDEVIHYPERYRTSIGARMTAEDHRWIRYSMDGGIPVNGAVVQTGAGSLLVVSVDLQCCGGAPDDWYEDRRRVEAKVTRQLIRKVLARTRVKGIVVAGDFNSVATDVPFTLVSKHYRPPHFGLELAVPTHRGSEETWTWDGRGTPFESSALDRQFFSPASLAIQAQIIFDTEDLDAQTLESLGLQADSTRRLSRHRPLVIDYTWKNH